MPMTWTQEKPTAPGKWLYRGNGTDFSCLDIHQNEHNGALYYGNMPVFSMNNQWSSEPIEPPQEPAP